MFRLQNLRERSTKSRRLGSRLLRCESLENRELFSVSPLGANADIQEDTADAVSAAYSLSPIRLDSGTIEIDGTSSIDIVSVTQVTASVIGGGPASATVNVRLEHATSGDVVLRSFDKALVDAITFHGGDGNDHFSNSTDVPSEVWGEGGPDIITGGSGNDILRGGADEDTIYGGGGDDTIYGGGLEDQLFGDGGNDEIYGMDGSDTIEGGAGDDYLDGGDQGDELSGGDDDDTIHGGSGPDELRGQRGADELFGDDGNDTLLGGRGADELRGGEGRDDLQGGLGTDEMWGNEGDDLLEGNEDDDTLHGGDGSDRLYGSGGEDDLQGGRGNDGLWGGGGVDTLTGGDGADRYLIYDVRDSDDTITTKTDNDVELFFEDGRRKTFDHFLGFGGLTYDDGSWSYNEIIEVDDAFSALVERTNNNALLRTEPGREMTFYRLGAHVSGDNSDGDIAGANVEGRPKIHFTQPAFDDFAVDGSNHRTSDDDALHQIVWHEIGHEWDTKNHDYAGWKDISGWHKPFLGSWQFDNDDEFVSVLAQRGPEQDFADTFAFYFAMQEEEVWDGLPGVNSPDDIPEKFQFMEDFLDTLTT